MHPSKAGLPYFAQAGFPFKLWVGRMARFLQGGVQVPTGGDGRSASAREAWKSSRTSRPDCVRIASRR